MTSDALTRPARAILAQIITRNCEIAGVPFDDARYDEVDVMVADQHARAAILSFLSGEDVVEACARALAHEDWTGESAEFRATRLEVSAEKAQRAIAALRALVQEEK